MKSFSHTIIGFSFITFILVALWLGFLLFDQQMRVAFAQDNNQTQKEILPPQEHSEEDAVKFEETTKVCRVVKFYVQFDIKFIDIQDELGKYSTLTFVNHPSCQKDPHLMVAEIEEDKYYKFTTIDDPSFNERDRIVVNLESPE